MPNEEGYISHLDMAVATLRTAAQDHAMNGRGGADADALHDLIRSASGIRERLSAETVLDGHTRMVPAHSLVAGDQLVGTDGTAAECVVAVARQPYTVTVHTGTASYAVDRADLVEIAT